MYFFPCTLLRIGNPSETFRKALPPLKGVKRIFVFKTLTFEWLLIVSLKLTIPTKELIGASVENGVRCAGARYWTSNRRVYVNIDRLLLSANLNCGYHPSYSPNMIDLRQIDSFFWKPPYSTSKRILKAIVV
jgi:hypothetical protein